MLIIENIQKIISSFKIVRNHFEIKIILYILLIKSVEITRIYFKPYKNWRPCAIIYISSFYAIPKNFRDTSRQSICSFMRHESLHLSHRGIAFSSRIFASHVSSVSIVLAQMISLNLYEKENEGEKERVSKESSTTSAQFSRKCNQNSTKRKKPARK